MNRQEGLALMSRLKKLSKERLILVLMMVRISSEVIIGLVEDQSYEITLEQVLEEMDQLSGEEMVTCPPVKKVDNEPQTTARFYKSEEDYKNGISTPVKEIEDEINKRTVKFN